MTALSRKQDQTSEAQMKRRIVGWLRESVRVGDAGTLCQKKLEDCWSVLDDCLTPTRFNTWSIVQEYLRGAGEFYEDMTTVELVKAASSFDFDTVAFFSSPICDGTMVLMREQDAQIMLVTTNASRVSEIDLHRWTVNANRSISFENRYFGSTFNHTKRSRTSKNPIEFLATSLRLDQIDEARKPILRWWSEGSGAERTLSWHHNLFTWHEIQDAKLSFKPREVVGESRRDAIPGQWRHIFDFDRERSHVVEVPELEIVLGGLPL
jgi:hypothetical protein